MKFTAPILIAAVTAQNYADMVPPPGFEELCKGRQNIVKWENVPHDWAYKAYTDGKPNSQNPDCDAWNGAFPKLPHCSEGTGEENNGKKNYEHKDYWSWEPNWRDAIATGNMAAEDLSNGGAKKGTCQWSNQMLGDPITFCLPGAVGCDTVVGDGNLLSVAGKCRKACADKYTTEDNVRSRCNYFSFDRDAGTCMLFKEPCGQWNLQAKADYAYNSGQAPNIVAKTIDTTNMITQRITNIFPVGFKPFDLREFNEPPICIWVPNSGDKKVEVMIETEMNDASICIRDGSDLGIGRNSEVGNVDTCNEGRLEACFTAATREGRKDFFFMIYCEGSCEATDIDLWLRIRASRSDWNVGKKTTEDDIEMWCEMEKGSTSQYQVIDENGQVVLGDDNIPLFEARNDYTWPTDLLGIQQPNPGNDPFKVTYRPTLHSSANKIQVTLVAFALGIAAMLF